MTFEEFQALSSAKQRELMIADGVMCKYDDPEHIDSDACPSCRGVAKASTLLYRGEHATERLFFMGLLGPLYHLGKSLTRRGKNPDMYGPSRRR